MEPLCITWSLNRPMVCSDYPIHLDSLVAWALVDEARENGVEDCFSVIENLPLEKTADNIWKASVLIRYPASSIQVTSMTKPFNVYMEDAGVFYETKIKRFTPGSGKFKAFDLRVASQWQEKVVAWCIGEKGRLKELLSRIQNLGKLSRNNFGQIISLEITKDIEAKQLWELRTTPLSLEAPPKKGFARAMRVCRPPYWDKTKFEPCQTPVDPEKIARINCKHNLARGSQYALLKA